MLGVAMKRSSTRHTDGSELLWCSVSLWLRQHFAVPLSLENLGVTGSRVVPRQVQCCGEPALFVPLAASSSPTHSLSLWLYFCCLIKTMLCHRSPDPHPGWPRPPPSKAQPICPWGGMEPGTLSWIPSARPRGTSQCGSLGFGAKVTMGKSFSPVTLEGALDAVSVEEVTSTPSMLLTATRVECCADTPQFSGSPGVRALQGGCSSLVKPSRLFLPLLSRWQHSLGVRAELPKWVFARSAKNIYYCTQRN